MRAIDDPVHEPSEERHAARLSRELLRRAHEVARIGTFAIDLRREVIQLSAEMSRLFRAGGEAFEMPLAEYRRRFYHPDDRAKAVESADAAYDARRGLALEARVVCGDGAIIWLRSSSSVEVDDRGESLVVGVVMDITSAREAKIKADEQAALLAEKEALLQEFVRHTPAAVAMFDLDLRYLSASERWISDYHLGGEDVVGRLHYEVFPEIPERWKAIHGRVLAGAVERCDEDPFPRADGTTDWLAWECRPWRTAAGAVGGMIMFTQVITARVQAEERLRHSEERFRQLTENSLAGIYIAQDNRFIYANPALERIFGVEPGTLVGRDFHTLIHPEDHALAAERVSDRTERGAQAVHYEIRAVKPDGTIAWLEVLGSTMLHQGRPAMFGNLLDVTARREADGRLRDSEARFRSLSEGAPAGIYIIQDGVFSYTNPALERMADAAPGELLGSPLLHLVHPEDRARAPSTYVAAPPARRRPPDTRRAGCERTAPSCGTSCSAAGSTSASAPR